MLLEEQTKIDSPDRISVGRVSLEHRSRYVVITGRGEIPAMPVGRMYYDPGPDGMPVVGDMVEIRILDEDPPHAIITSILPRKSLFARKEAGKRMGVQPIAANIDTVFIVCGLDANFRVRRIERYLTLSLESGAQPVIVLTKADICDDVEEKIEAVRASAAGWPVYAISTTRPALLFRGLRLFGVPRMFIILLGMMQRYLAVLIKSAEEIHLAKISRSVTSTNLRQEQAWVASGMGSLFRRTRAMGNAVYLAMLSRGYAGEVYLLDDPKWRIRDLAFIGLAAALSALMLIMS